MTALTTMNRICQHLEKYVYDKIWNEPYSEYRTYIRMPIINQTVTTGSGATLTTKYLPASGYFAGRYSRILLPPFSSNDEIVSGDWFPTSTPKFYIFTVPAAFFSPIQVNVQDWMLLSEYCNLNLVSLQVFHKDGTIFNRGSIYIKQADMNDCMLVAVNAAMYETLAGTADPSNTYFGKYHDSDSVADNVVHAGKLTSTTAKTPSEYDLSNATFIFYNGKLCSGSSYANFFVQGNYLETVHDEDVIATFDVECLESHNAPIYKDNITEAGEEGTKKNRLLIHIPKSLNPNNYLITPHTCELFLVPRNMSAGNPALSGVYVYPCGRDASFAQIGHSDFSVDLDLLTNIASANNFTDYVLRVFVRIHEKKRVVVRDASYVDILYNLDDDEIISFLLGKHDWQTKYTEIDDYVVGTQYYRKSGDTYIAVSISSKAEFLTAKETYTTLYRHPLLFWTADYLENCKYADALIRRRAVVNNAPRYEIDEETGKYVMVQDQCSRCGLHTRCSDVELAGADITDRICPCYSVRSIQDYIDILGYFHVLALVGKRISHFKVKVAGTTSVVVYTPLALSVPELAVGDYYPIVYHNGIRIDQDRISFSTTTGDNTGVEEIYSDSDYLKGTGVIQSNYATRLKISIDPKYHQSTHHRFVEDGIYYLKDEDGDYVLATGCSYAEWEAMTEEQRALIDYRYGELIHQNTYDLIDESEETFVSGLVYYAKTEAGVYNQLVEGTDYNIGDSTTEWITTHYMSLYHKWDLYYNADEEFKKDDIIAVELFDDRKDGQIKHYKRSSSSETLNIQMATLDQWKVYKSTKTTVGEKSTIAYEYVASPGSFDASTKILTIGAALVGYDIFVVEGPKVVPNEADLTITNESSGYIGKEFWKDVYESYPTSEETNFPLDMELVFLNGKRLIKNLDYNVEGYEDETVNKVGIRLYEQNLSYLRESTHVDALRTCTTNISNQYGFLLGKSVSWVGRAPLWFDELSTLTIDGVLCSHFTHTLGTVSITDDNHRNGAPYEIRTAVSTRVKEIIACDDSMGDDKQKIIEIREFFEEVSEMPPMRSIIPHSHKIYSTYIEAICAAFLDADDSFDFFKVGETTTKAVGDLPSGTLVTDANFEKQFSKWSDLKEHDLTYKFTQYDLGFVDIYPLYHRTETRYRETYNKLVYLYNKLLPVDDIKHKDAPYDN